MGLGGSGAAPVPRRAALRLGLGATAVAAAGSCARTAPPAGERDSTTPPGAFAHNVEVLGYSTLDERPGFKMAVREKAGRWYLYIGHSWSPGWSVLDVTDPTSPIVLSYTPIPGDKPGTYTLRSTFGNQVVIADNIMITAMERVFPIGTTLRPDPATPYQEGVLLWDISTPQRPVMLAHWKTGSTGTHRNLYAGGRYAHLAAAMPGFTGNIYVILDIADPRNPTIAGQWWVPGQETTNRPTPSQAHGLCCGAGAHISLHGPPYPTPDNLVYLPYGGAGLIVLDISDIANPRQIGHLPFSPPFHQQFGVHGVLPLPEHGIAFANSENVTYGEGPAHHASIIDITNPAQPFLLSLLPEPVPPAEAPYRDFTTRGGWRGPHNLNHHHYHPDVQKYQGLCYIAHFNAGLRIYDTTNSRLPREVGYFIPPEPAKRYGPLPEGPLVLQTEDVVVDRRGHIYITDKNQGLWILRYTGPTPTLT